MTAPPPAGHATPSGGAASGSSSRPNGAALSTHPLLRAAVLLLAAAAVLLSAGCRRSRPDFDSPYDLRGPDILRDGSLGEIASVVSHRARDHQHLVRQGRIVLEADGQRVWFDGNILVRTDPPAVRLRGSRVPAGTLFEIALRGGDAWVYLNRDRELFVGTREELARQTGLEGAISLEELVASILVLQDLKARLAEPGRWRVLPTRREVLLARTEPDGRSAAWRIRRSDGLVREFVRFDPWGRAELRVTYESWVLEDGEPLPGQFVAEVDEGRVRLTMRLSQYRLGTPVSDAVFDELPRDARGIYALSDLATRESAVPIGDEEPEG